MRLKLSRLYLKHLFLKQELLSDVEISEPPLTMPHHATIKSSTLRTILTQAGIAREEFLRVYKRCEKGAALNSDLSFVELSS
jgi:hypothetical protein